MMPAGGRTRPRDKGGGGWGAGRRPRRRDEGRRGRGGGAMESWFPLVGRWWWLPIELRGQIHHPRRRPPRSPSRPALSPTSPLFPDGGRRASQWMPAAHAEDSSPPPRWLLILPSIAAAAHGEFQFPSLPFPHI